MAKGKLKPIYLEHLGLDSTSGWEGLFIRDPIQKELLQFKWSDV